MTLKSEFQNEHSISGKNGCLNRNKFMLSSIVMDSSTINVLIEAFCWFYKNMILYKIEYSINILSTQKINYLQKRNISCIAINLYNTP